MVPTGNAKATAALCLSFLFFFSHVSGGYVPIPRNPTLPSRWPRKLPPANPFCPRDVLKLGACADLLGVVGVIVGKPPGKGNCCAVLDGLAAAEAAACLCTVVKECALGIVTEWSVAVSVLVSACKTEIPDSFKCI